MSLETRNAGTRITSDLREAILNGRWQPTTRLQLTELSTEFGVSTTVIRETLTRLAVEGLVENLPNRGFFMRDLSLRELSDITELRCASDSIAVKLSITRGDLQWESELTALHHQLARTPRRSADDPDHFTPEWSRIHREFHLKLIGACDCEPMITLASNLMSKTELYRQWAAPAPSASQRDVEREHLELLEAALDRNVERTTELLISHYRRTVDVVLESGLAIKFPEATS